MSKYTKAIQAVFSVGCCALTLMPAGALALVSDSFNSGVLKTLTYSQLKAGKIVVPLQISPMQIEAPLRRIDLFPRQAKLDNSQPQSYPLSGFPTDLNNYSILNFGTNNVNSALWGINFELDTQTKGIADTLVHIGDPVLFPDMVDTRINFRSAEFAPKGRIYSIKRKVGLGGDEKWRYTPQNVVVKGIANGVVGASFVPGSDLVLTRAFASLDIEKAPWLNYEYTLPEKGAWSVQINAIVDIGGFSRDVMLFSKPFKGEGKQRLLLNLDDLLHKENPGAKGGRLKDLVIHFILDPSSAAAKDVRIDLGRLDFYRVQQLVQGDIHNRLLLVPDRSKPVNLVEMLNKLDYVGELKVLSGSLIRYPQGSAGKPDVLPEINIQADYSETIPKFFVGEAFYLDDLNSNELSAVLDQKLFLKKDILWQTGRSAEILLKQIPSDGFDGMSLPLIKYMPEVSVGDGSYIYMDYAFGGGEQLPVYLTLTGTDYQGRSISYDRLLSNNKPIKVDGMKLQQMALSFRRANASSSLPKSFLVKKIQISRMQKSQTFYPIKSTTSFLLEASFASVASISPPIKPQVVWKTVPEQIAFARHGKEEMQTIRSYVISQKIVGDSIVLVDMVPSGVESLYLRVKGKKRNVQIEQLFPLSNHCSVNLKDLELQGVDLVVKASRGVATGQVQIKQLEVGLAGEVPPNLIWSMPSQNFEVSVLGSADVQTAATFKVDKKISGGAVLEYAIALSSGPAMSYRMRIRGENAMGAFERLIPLALEGGIILPEMHLNSLEFVVLGGDGALTSTVYLNHLSVKKSKLVDKHTIHNLDTSFSYDEIVEGKKLFNLPPSVVPQGEVRIDYTSSEYFDVSISPDYLNANQTSPPAPSAADSPKKEKSKALLYAVVGVIVVLLYATLSKQIIVWIRRTYPTLYEVLCWVVEIALLSVAYYMAFKSRSEHAFSWSGAALVFAFGFAIRWKIRPLLTRKWSYFGNHYSAPYFILFLLLLLSCVALLMLKMDIVAGKLAVIGYFLLVMGVVVEFLQFSKEAKLDRAE